MCWSLHKLLLGATCCALAPDRYPSTSTPSHPTPRHPSQDVAPAGLHSVFERFRAILHEGSIDKRTQYIIEGLFAIRKVRCAVQTARSTRPDAGHTPPRSNRPQPLKAPFS